MEFVDYLKTSGTLNAQQITALRDTADIGRRSVYQEIHECSSERIYHLPYDELEKHIVEWGKANNIPIEALKDGSGLTCDVAIYERTGGVTSDNAHYFIPLIREKNNNRLLVCLRPDDSMFIAKMTAAYRNTPFTIAVCDSKMWDSLRQLFVGPLHVSSIASEFSDGDNRFNKISDTAAASPARRLYNTVLDAGMIHRASDIQFVPRSDGCDIIFRIDGKRQLYSKISKDAASRIVNIAKVDAGNPSLNDFDIVDGKLRYTPLDENLDRSKAVDIRISVMPSIHGADLNIRYLSSKLRGFDELGISPENIKRYKQLLHLPNGLVVQTGPTGSGKSTTLYAGLDYIRKDLRNIITIEDPVEIMMDGITQVNITATKDNNISGVTAGDALKASLRHDPDVIVVGEMRDREMAEDTIRAANTGHLVLASIHTNDSIGVFERLLNMGIDSHSLGEVMAAVMGQRLVRRLCPYCKEPYTLNLKSDVARFHRLPNRDGFLKLYKPVGCIRCGNTGYHGRIAINEILVIDRELRSLIQRRAIRSVMEDYLRSQNFVSMYNDGINKVCQGITSLEEMTEFAADNVSFKG